MARYRVEFLPTAARELAKLHADVQQRIGRKLDALEWNPRPPGAKSLQGEDGFLRIRVADYRVIYRVEDRAVVWLVIKVGHRREVYR